MRKPLVKARSKVRSDAKSRIDCRQMFSCGTTLAKALPARELFLTGVKALQRPEIETDIGTEFDAIPYSPAISQRLGEECDVAGDKGWVGIPQRIVGTELSFPELILLGSHLGSTLP
jgi:hypothetical protein